MGVRFECPAGHKLHVKAHLSGQRGICPDCGARFIVPSFSGGRVAEAPGAEASAGGGFASVALESSASFAAGLNAAAGSDGDDGDDPIAWYVRHAGGEQYGPVNTVVFAKWVDEGRVPGDGWVWRTGWTDWRPGADALQAFVAADAPARKPALAPQPGATRGAANRSPRAPLGSAARSTPSGLSSDTPLPTFGDDLDAIFAVPRNGRVPAPVAAAATEQPIVGPRAAQQRRQKQLNQWLTVGLAVLALVLLIVAIVVLNRPAEPAVDDANAPIAGEPFSDVPATSGASAPNATARLR